MTLSPAIGPRPEVTTVANDEVVIHTGTSVERFRDLTPDTDVTIEGFEIRTLPERGELLTTFTTVNDVHIGEIPADDVPPELMPDPADGSYSEFMSAGAVDEMSRIDPALVVVKGDLTSWGAVEQYERFLEIYQVPFGDRMIHIRGNHESYHHLQVPTDDMIERRLEGVTIAMIDTSGDGRVNGSISTVQLEWLDELASRADQPVMVFGHHQIWDPANDLRSDKAFGLVPDDSERLFEVMARRPRMVGYFAGHTHRNKRVVVDGLPGRVFVEAAAVKDYPGTWVEYRVFEGQILQVHRRVSTPEALRWSEKARHMYDGFYGPYAFGELSDRCFAIPL